MKIRSGSVKKFGSDFFRQIAFFFVHASEKPGGIVDEMFMLENLMFGHSTSENEMRSPKKRRFLSTAKKF